MMSYWLLFNYHAFCLMRSRRIQAAMCTSKMSAEWQLGIKRDVFVRKDMPSVSSVLQSPLESLEVDLLALRSPTCYVSLYDSNHATLSLFFYVTSRLSKLRTFIYRSYLAENFVIP